MLRALFLDRDGVINHDVGYTHEWTESIIIDGIVDLIRKFRSQGFLIIIATNQSGIGRGYYTDQEFHKFMKSMTDYFEQKSATIDGYFYCSCNPEEKDCLNRKPNPGMLVNAAQSYGIDLQKSVMVGDKVTDMLAAGRADIGYKYLYDSNFESERVLDKKNDFFTVKSLTDIRTKDEKVRYDE